MDSETRDERLRQLRRVVIQAPDERFDMTYFGFDAGCGTVCCAAGWATLDAWHQQQTKILMYFGVDIDGSPYIRAGWSGAESLADIYGLNIEDSRRLFGLDYDDDSYNTHRVTKTLVINQIDRLLSGLPALSYGDPALTPEAVAR